jgi:DNA polymerase V
MSKPIYALIDCNNFYCSCERVFNPRLATQPVIVLSNNDGCVVARSEEVKAMGIPMGIPVFKIKELITKYNINVFSSNYALYGDMSRRVQSIVAQAIPHHQIYSIDEIFLRLDDDLDPFESAKKLRARVLQCTGIPTSIGIAHTKTLAKLANLHAKKNLKFEGVCDARSTALLTRLRRQTPVESIWGIGSALTKVCHRYGASTAEALSKLDPASLRKAHNIGLERLIRELGEVACFELETAPAPQKSCAVTRSFSHPVTDKAEMLEAVATYATRAAEKCRENGQVAQAMQVFMHTSPHREEYTWDALCAQMSPPNADTSIFLKTARTLANACWKAGYRYKKAGVILFDLSTHHQGSLNFISYDASKREQTMETLDAINHKYGRNSLFFGAQGINASWRMNREHCSPHSTTVLEEVPIVKAK